MNFNSKERFRARSALESRRLPITKSTSRCGRRRAERQVECIDRAGAVIRFPGSRAGAGLCRSTEPRFTIARLRGQPRSVPNLATAIKPTRYQRLLADDMMGARVYASATRTSYETCRR